MVVTRGPVRPQKVERISDAGWKSRNRTTMCVTGHVDLRSAGTHLPADLDSRSAGCLILYIRYCNPRYTERGSPGETRPPATSSGYTRSSALRIPKLSVAVGLTLTLALRCMSP